MMLWDIHSDDKWVGCGELSDCFGFVNEEFAKVEGLRHFTFHHPSKACA